MHVVRNSKIRERSLGVSGGPGWKIFFGSYNGKGEKPDPIEIAAFGHLAYSLDKDLYGKPSLFFGVTRPAPHNENECPCAHLEEDEALVLERKGREGVQPARQVLENIAHLG